MIERYFVQVLAVLAIGDLLRSRIGNTEQNEQSMANNIKENLPKAIILGYASLVLVMLVSGVFFDGILDETIYIYFGLGCIILTVKLIFFFRDSHTFRLGLPADRIQRFLSILISSYLMGYLLLSLILQERGWDALQYYFPNALFFYLQDHIVSDLNPFSLFPTFKPPLNTLYITYSFYVSKGMYANLHSFIFLVGSTILIYQLAERQTQNTHIAYFSSLIFLNLPIIVMMIYEYAFYQELPLIFFFLATFYYLQDLPEPGLQRIVLVSLSIALAILSKISGYALLFVLLVSFDTERIHKYVKIAIIGVITLFLTRKALFDIYWGSAVVVLLLGLGLIYILATSERQPMISSSLGLKLIVLPLVVGILWVIFMLQLDIVRDLLISIYLKTGDQSINWSFQQVATPSMVNFESGMRASFSASLLYILTSNFIGGTLVFFKIIGLSQHRKYPVLTRWLLSYYLLYFGYFSHVSGRYLMPLLPPLLIFTAIGIHTVFDRLQLAHQSRIICLLLILLSLDLIIFPVFPLRINAHALNERVYYYHVDQILLFIYLILIVVLLKLLAVRINRLSLPMQNRAMIILGIICVSPFALPLGVHVADKIRDKEPNALLNYYSRPAYQNVISELQVFGLELEQTIMSVNTPGLGYFIQRTVFDIYLVSGRELGVSAEDLNRTEAWDILVELNVIFFITIRPGNFFYNHYQAEFADLPLVKLVNEPAHFELYYFNNEYGLYRRLHSGSIS